MGRDGPELILLPLHSDCWPYRHERPPVASCELIMTCPYPPKSRLLLSGHAYNGLQSVEESPGV